MREHRRCPEYLENVLTGQVDATGQFRDRTQRGSTQVRWFGQDLSRAPDSGIGYNQNHRTQWASGDWVEPDSYHLTGSQLMGRKRRAGDRLATSPNVDEVVHRRENRWGTTRKRTLFGSDGPDSTTSGSDVVEAQYWGPPDDGYPIVAQSGLLYENDSLKEAWSPSRKLEDAVQVQVLYFSIYIAITNMEGWVLKHCCCNPETRTSTHPTHIHTFTHKHTLTHYASCTEP